MFRITSDTWLPILGDKPTDALWGVGSRTAKRLAELSIMTVAELAAASPRELAPHFGPTIGPWLVQLGRGIDLSKVTDEPWMARSRSREVTFQSNLTDWAQVGEEVAKIARIVSSDVAAEGRLAARIVVKVRFAPFFTKTHGRALAEPTAGSGRDRGGGAGRAGRVHQAGSGAAARGQGRVRRGRLIAGGRAGRARPGSAGHCQAGLGPAAMISALPDKNGCDATGTR